MKNKKSSTADRRNFLQSGMFGAAGLGLAVSTSSSVVMAESDKSTIKRDVTNEVDVLVVGGGTAGVIAAIQAGRAGAKTLLVERNFQLGGATTTGGVAFPGLFDAWGKQVIAGIGWELVKESVELDGGKFPNFAKVPRSHWMNQVHVNQFVYALLAEEKCREAEVELAYYEFPEGAVKTDTGWQVDCIGFGTRRQVNCKQIIDCTGGAEVVGHPCTRRSGRPSTEDPPRRARPSEFEARLRTSPLAAVRIRSQVHRRHASPEEQLTVRAGPPLARWC